MSKLISDDGRTHVKSTLMRESLQNRGVLAGTDSDRDLQILPNVSLVSVGGQSIFDRGADAIRQVADEIAEGKKSHNIVVGVGGGTRVRHTASIALDLGLPVGGIAQLVGAMEELNAVVLTAVLAKHNSIPMQRDHFWDLPLYFNAGMIPICISVPPYHLWEPPPESGHLPAHGSDFGLFQLSEVLAFEQVIFVKDEDGLYDKDPKKHDDAVLIPKATLAELVDETGHCKLEESIIDKVIFWAWHQARNVKRIQIVNGLKKGELTRALAGEDNGTVITKE
jgi:molybdenum storage protein